MSPRPFYRWKSLSFGVLILIFLGWAWVRSTTSGDVLIYDTGSDQGVWIGHRWSKVIFISWQNMPASSGRGIHVLSTPLSNHKTCFPGPVTTGSEQGNREIEVAHWFLIVLFLIPWLGWLFWHGRRMKRLAASKN